MLGHYVNYLIFLNSKISIWFFLNVPLSVLRFLIFFIISIFSFVSTNIRAVFQSLSTDSNIWVISIGFLNMGQIFNYGLVIVNEGIMEISVLIIFLKRLLFFVCVGTQLTRLNSNSKLPLLRWAEAENCFILLALPGLFGVCHMHA